MMTDTASHTADASPDAPGRFITIEGIDGAGKSTLAGMLADTLRQRGLEVVSTREPGGSPLAEKLRTLILAHDDLDPDTELLLMFAARRDHIRHTIRPALECGHWVICDRFTGSIHAYQGAGRGADPTSITMLEHTMQDGLIPDHCILLDLDVETAMQRMSKRTTKSSRFDTEARTFFERTRAGFLLLAQHNRLGKQTVIVDAHRTPAETLEDVLRSLTMADEAPSPTHAAPPQWPDLENPPVLWTGAQSHLRICEYHAGDYLFLRDAPLPTYKPDTVLINALAEAASHYDLSSAKTLTGETRKRFHSLCRMAELGLLEPSAPDEIAARLTMDLANRYEIFCQTSQQHQNGTE